MNILYLGSLTSYVTQNDVNIFRSMGHNITILNPYPVPKNPESRLIEFKNIVNIYDQKLLGILYAAIGGTFTPILLSALRHKAGVIKEKMKDRQIDLIYATWGSNMIPVVKIIQKTKLKVPIVYNFLSYPQNVYRWKVLLENWYCRRPIENLDGRIHATKDMHSYMDHRFNLRKQGLDIVMTPFFSKKYFFRRRLPLLSENDEAPHLVFIGPISLPWDDIRQEIYRITRKKIYFHMAWTNVPIKGNPYLHFFSYFPLQRLIDGSLATFMTQFDACIVLFNFKVCSCMDRFHTSYPSRFLFALNAGIPIVMPRGYLPACEEFVNEHQIGFAYRKLTQLKEMLNDEDLMLRYRRNAIKKTADFTYEKNFYRLDKLIKTVTS